MILSRQAQVTFIFHSGTKLSHAHSFSKRKFLNSSSHHPRCHRRGRLNVQAAAKFLPDFCAGKLYTHSARSEPTFVAQDHAVAGIGAGTVAVLCMHPLDLLKVKLQTSTEKPQGGVGRQIWYSLRDIYGTQGLRGLYRGVGANIAGNASSWGLYFLL